MLWLVCRAALAWADYDAGMEWYRKAWAAYSAQQYQDAGAHARQALRADPTNPHAQALLGDLAYLAHDLAEARAAWAKALALEPRLRALRERLDQLDRERALEDGQVAGRTELFVIRVPAAAGPVDLPWVTSELAAARAFLEPRLGVRLEGPISVLVYPPEVFHGTLHLPMAVAGLFDGTIRMPSRPGPHGPPLNAVLWHELAHAAVHQLTDGRAPRWLHEGVAEAVQHTVEPLTHEALAIAARRQDAPSLAVLEGRGRTGGEPAPLEAGLFYQASWAHVQYLIEHRGWEGLRGVLAAVGRGAPAAEALVQAAGTDEAAWDRQWRRWLWERFTGDDF